MCYDYVLIDFPRMSSFPFWFMPTIAAHISSSTINYF